MGIVKKIKKAFEKGETRDRCTRDPDTGITNCKRIRKHEDGTEQELAGFSAQVDASCNVLSENTFENEEGNLEDLEKKFVPRLVGKCKNTPEDY